MADILQNTIKDDEPLNQNPLTGITDQQKSVLQLLAPYIVGKNIQVEPNGDIRIGSPTDSAQQVSYDASTDTLTVPASTPNVANRGWVLTNVFSSTDADTVSWGAGSFISSDGTTYSIGAGNTGNMSAKTFIYLDTNVSTTAYQTTTTASTAVGAGKVLVAIAENGATEATFFVLNDDSKKLDASDIVANSITANKLSTSITYAGSIIIDSAGHIRSGQTAYNTGTGWFIGNDGGVAKISIGSPTGDHITFDGTTLDIQAALRVSQSYTADGAIAIGDVVVQAATASEASTQSADNIGAVDHDDTTWSSVFTSSIFQIIELDKANSLYVGLGKTSGGAVVVSLGSYKRGVLTWTDSSQITASGDPSSICKLSTTKFMVMYSDSNGTEVKAVSVSGTTMTVGSANNLTVNASLQSGSLVQLDTDKAHAVWLSTSGGSIQSAVLTTSGTTITENDTQTLSTNDQSGGVQSALIDTNKIAVWSGHASGAFTARLRIITVSETTQTLGTAVGLSSIRYPGTDHSRGQIIRIATDKLMILGHDGTNIEAVIASVSGTTPTLGTEVTIFSSSGSGSGLGFGALLTDTDTVLLTYSENNAQSLAQFVTFSGTTITTGTEFLMGDKEVNLYPNYDYGDLALNSDNFPFEFFIYQKNTTIFLSYIRATKRAIGIADAAIADNASGVIVNKGRITGLSGLAVGDEIRDRFDYRVIAVADTTTSVVVL